MIKYANGLKSKKAKTLTISKSAFDVPDPIKNQLWDFFNEKSDHQYDYGSARAGCSEEDILSGLEELDNIFLDKLD